MEEADGVYKVKGDEQKQGLLVLSDNIRNRTTFCHKSSGTDLPATKEYYAHVLNTLTNVDLVAVLNFTENGVSGFRKYNMSMGVQVHGPISLADDVKSILLPGKMDEVEDGFEDLQKAVATVFSGEVLPLNL